MRRSTTLAFLGSWRMIAWTETQLAELANTISIEVFMRRELTCVDTWKDERTTADELSSADEPTITAEKQHTIKSGSNMLCISSFVCYWFSVVVIMVLLDCSCIY